MANATSTQLQELYVAYFGRAADPTGLDYWTEKGITQAAFAANQYLQPEFKSAYGSKSTEAQVNQIYKNLFDREADVTGLTYWTQQINLGKIQLAEIATHLIWAAQNNDGSEADKTALTNRTAAAEAYTAEVKTSTQAILAFQPKSSDPWEAGVNITEAVTYLSGIDGTTAHTADGVTASVATIVTNGDPVSYVAPVAASTVAQSLTLTTGVDTLSGAAGDDTISGTVGNDEPTITAGDSVTGGDGTDIFTIVSTGTAGTVAGVSIAGIETVRVSDTSTGATTINLAGQSGFTTLESFGSAHTGAMTFSNVGAITDLSLSNTSGAGTTTVTYTTATVEGSSDSQNITLDTATGTGDVTIAGVETVAITASGESSVDLVAAAATTVTVAAADDTTVTLSNAANTSLATVTTSGAGAANYVLDYSLSEISVTGTDQDDTFDTSAGAMGVNDTLDGGAGTGDKLLFQSTAASPATANIAATTATISNVEILELEADNGANDTAFTVDLDIADGVTSIELDANDTTAANSFTLNDINATQLAAISVDMVAGGATIVVDQKDGTGTADTQTVTATMGASDGTLTLTDSNNDIENLNLTVTGDADQTIAITAADYTGTTANPATLTVTGGATDRTMTFSNALSSDTVDMSGVKSDIVATLATSINHTVTGGDGDDTFTFTTGLTGDDTVTGGAGNDRIIIDPSANMAIAPTITGVEELEIGATAVASLTLTSLTIPEVVLQAQAAVTNVVTLTNFAGLTTITADSGAANTSDDFNGITIAGTGYAGTADAVTFNITADTDASTFGVMTLTGVEDVTINVTGDADDEDVTFNNIVSTSLNNVTITSSGYGATSTSTDIVLAAVNDGGSNTMLTFDASGANTGVSVTLADMSASSTVTGSGYYDIIDITGSGANVIVNGNAGNDTITGTTGVDQLYGGAGNDTINSGDTDTATTATQIFAGAGNDTVTVDEGDVVTLGAGVDTVFIDSATTINATPDIVSLDLQDFAAGAGGDIIDFGNASTSIAIDADYIAFAGSTNEAGYVAATGTNVSATLGLTVLTASTASATDVDTLTTIVAALNDLAGDGGTTTDIFDTTANTDDGLVLVDDGTDTALVHYEGDTTNAALSATDLDIVAIFRNQETSDFVSANFADFVN